VVSQLAEVNFVLSDAGSQCSYDRLYLVVGEHLVQPRLFDVQDLPAKRQDRLDLPVPSLFRRASGAVALNKEDLAKAWVPFLAVGELAGKHVVVEGAFPSRQFPCLARRFSRPCRVGNFPDYIFRNRRVFLEITGEELVQKPFHKPLYLGIPELSLRLAFELRIRDFYRDDGSKPFPDIIAGERDLEVFQHRARSCVVVHAPCQSRTEAREMGSPLNCMN